jgi:hypothetical protein
VVRCAAPPGPAACGSPIPERRILRVSAEVLRVLFEEIPAKNTVEK